MRAGDNQLELDLGGDLKRDSVLRVPSPARVTVPALLPAWLMIRLGKQMFCHPLARGEASLALGWKGGEEQGSKRSMLPLLPQPGAGFVLTFSFLFTVRKEKGFGEYLKETVRWALGQVLQLSSVQLCSRSMETALTYQKIPWV